MVRAYNFFCGSLIQESYPGIIINLTFKQRLGIALAYDLYFIISFAGSTVMVSRYT